MNGLAVRNLLAVAAGIGLWCGCPGSFSPEPILPVSIGFMAPLADGDPDIEQTLLGAHLAIETMNAAGGTFAGRPLELTSIDSGANALAAFDTFARQNTPFISAESAQTTQSLVSPTAQLGLTHISTTASQTSLTAAQDNDTVPSFFRTVANDDRASAAFMRLATAGYQATGAMGFESGCPYVIVAHSPATHDRELADAFAADVDDEPVLVSGAGSPLVDANGLQYRSRVLITISVASTGAGMVDVSDAVFAIENAMATDTTTPFPPVCLFGALGHDDAVSFVQALEAQAPTVPLHAILSDAAFRGTWPAVNTRVASLRPGVDESTAHFSAFARQFKLRFDVSPNEAAAFGFDAVIALGLAIGRAQSTVPLDVRTSLLALSGNSSALVESEDVDPSGLYAGSAATIFAGNEINYRGPSGSLDFDNAGNVDGGFALWALSGLTPTFVSYVAE